MDTNNFSDKDYVESFNQGYSIAGARPDLAQKISQAIGNTERGVGFTDGMKQLEFDFQKERMPNWLKQNNPSLSNPTPPQKEKGKDYMPDL